MTPYTDTNTFGATDPLGLANANWDYVESPVDDSKDAAVAKGHAGEYIPGTHTTFNQKQEVRCKYVAKVLGAVEPPAVTLGADDAGGWHITGAKLSSSNTGHLTLEVTAHKHIGGQQAVHVANPHLIEWPTVNGFGCFDPMGTNITPAQMQTSSFDASIEHVDDQDHVGNFLCGRSQGLKVTGSIEAVTDVTAPTLGAGWKQTSANQKRGGEGFYGLSISAEMYPGDAWVPEE